MKVKVTGSATVKPAMATPTTAMWISNMDAIMSTMHVPTLYFYRSSGAHDFFDAAVVKASLSRTLVEFYPLAGRLSKDPNGRVEINCNAEGALFVEAECDSVVDDFADWLPKPEINLVPQVDYSQGISSFPLLLVQVTHFKCGGVSLGFAYEHHVMDGSTRNYLMHAWAEVARGGDISPKPFLDRRILAARNPPRPQFPHVEYQPPPTLENPIDDSEMVSSIVKLTRDKLNALKSKCQDATVKFTTYETLAGHLWRCISKVRGLPEHQETMLRIPVNGRSRLRPPLPPGYMGNVVFRASTVALCGELVSNPLQFAVRKIHDAIARMDDDYLRSTIDHLETVQCELDPRTRGSAPFRCPNLAVVSWAKFDFYDIDFGWGCPIHLGFTGSPPPEGNILVLPTPANDGGLLCLVVLPKEQMVAFEKLFYHI